MGKSQSLALTSCLVGSLLWISGCFTEVGNAENDRVTAEFRIDYSNNPQPLPKPATWVPDPDSVHILHFYLLVKEAVYHMTDSASGSRVDKFLWREGSVSVPVDFTGGDKNAILPTETMDGKNPLNLVLEFEFPIQASLLSDTLDFDGFKDQGYIKGTYGVGAGALNFLFAFPQSTEIHLTYSQAALNSWFKGNVYECQFIFFASKWVSGIGISQAVTVKDKMGHPLAVFDNTHNPGLYKSLVSAFYTSFNTAQVSVETH